MYRLSALSILLLALGAADVAGREWWDNTGRYRVEAKFVSSDGRTVHLRRGDGSTIAVPLERLSEDDREFALDANRAANEKEPASSEAGETKRLLGQFLERPSRETFLAARQTLIASPHYKPYSTEPLDLQAHLNASRYDLVLEKMTNDENYWLSPWGRQMASAAALGKGDVRLAVMERRNALLCVEGILSTGDGTVERPYLVSRILDEYDVLNHLNKKRSRRALLSKPMESGETRWFDEMVCTDGSTIYFDVTDMINSAQAQQMTKSGQPTGEKLAEH